MTSTGLLFWVNRHKAIGMGLIMGAGIYLPSMGAVMILAGFYNNGALEAEKAAVAYAAGEEKWSELAAVTTDEEYAETVKVLPTLKYDEYYVVNDKWMVSSSNNLLELPKDVVNSAKSESKLGIGDHAWVSPTTWGKTDGIEWSLGFVVNPEDVPDWVTDKFVPTSTE